MRWVLGAGALIVALVALVFGVGALLPIAHIAQVSGEVSGTPEEVWAVVTDVERFPSWRSDVSRVERVQRPSGRPAWREEGSSGAFTLEVTELLPPSRMVTRIADEGLPFGGSWTYELTPSGDGTRVVLTENGVIYNAAFRFMARFVFGYSSTLETYLGQLEARMAGEPTAR
jgi:uncharacterized protein YndB with AHSA1/START domain